MTEVELKINVYIRASEYMVDMHAQLDRETYRRLMELLTELHADVLQG